MAEHRDESSNESSARSTVGQIRDAYTEALLGGDQIGAEIAIREAIDANLTTAQIDEQIMTPALWLIGQLWARGEISIADEHVATEISTRVLALQHEAQRLVHSRGHHRVLLAAPGGEQHLVALRMIANLLQDAGYEVIMLGAEVSGDALVEALSRHRPHVICVSATLPPGADELPGLIQRLSEHNPQTGFVIGGRGLDPTVIGELSTLPRTHACQRLSEIVESVDALVKRADLN